MSKFQMYDSVTLNQDIHLHTGEIAPQGTDGAIAVKLSTTDRKSWCRIAE
ncbi:MAG: hypothetical protein ACOYN8_14690 [Pseudanabaena sp.]|jgi:peptidyl-tRNA hydrolase